MKIIVTAKLVPDASATKRIDPASKRLIRSGLPTVVNPFDEYAIEAALQLKERLPDVSVTIFAMAPESLKETLRKPLAMGADDAVFLTDPNLDGSDVFQTAAAMSAALRKTGFDLILSGALSDDGNTGGVPCALAEMLGVPSITNVRKIEDVAGGRFRGQRETDSGYQVVSGPLPALVTVTMAVGEPRFASLKGIMGAKKKPITQLALSELGIDAGEPKTKVVEISAPKARERARIVESPDPQTGAQAIFDFLRERKLV